MGRRCSGRVTSTRVLVLTIALVTAAAACGSGDGSGSQDGVSRASDAADGRSSEASAGTNAGTTETSGPTIAPPSSTTGSPSRSTGTDGGAGGDVDSQETTTTAEVTTTRPTGSGEPFPSDPPPSGVTAAPSRSAGATGLRSEPRCDPDAPSVGLADLFWSPAAEPGDQRVAVTTRSNGFDTGNYAVTRPLRPDTATHTLREVQAGGVYYWRVLTQHGDQWHASDTATFTGPTCVHDQP